MYFYLIQDSNTNGIKIVISKRRQKHLRQLQTGTLGNLLYISGAPTHYQLRQSFQLVVTSLWF
ncbi:hypothetical protein Xen7305DRAFT_00037490 [Xenococcus sp. PCC 7305]|nr:hypothetical protein Xen7305DRAFT_00037490 [Xenococcus sp. PCC 7305]